MIKTKMVNMETWVEEIEDIFCNLCGVSISFHLPPPQDGLIKGGEGKLSFGYGSVRDTEVHRFHICDDCANKLCAGFAIPCDVTEEL